MSGFHGFNLILDNFEQIYPNKLNVVRFFKASISFKCSNNFGLKRLSKQTSSIKVGDIEHRKLRNGKYLSITDIWWKITNRETVTKVLTIAHKWSQLCAQCKLGGEITRQKQAKVTTVGKSEYYP